jgi:hypothetical protein
MIDGEGQATLVWLGDRIDASKRLMDSLGAWAGETGFALPDRSAAPAVRA